MEDRRVYGVYFTTRGQPWQVGALFSSLHFVRIQLERQLDGTAGGHGAAEPGGRRGGRTGPRTDGQIAAIRAEAGILPAAHRLAALPQRML